MERRTLIRLLGAAGTASAAGCVSFGGDETEESPTETPMTTDTDTQRDDAPEDGLVTVRSDEGFEATVDRIESDIEAAGVNLMTTVDHAANAESVDRELPPTTLFVFGNPDAGTPLMKGSRSVAIDLPQKMLVWEEESMVNVTYNDPRYLADRHGIDGQQERLENIRSLLDRLATGEG
jgi:uncharacterized protein (DUF302 family)